MIEQLIEALRIGGLEQPTWEDVADSIWLATQIRDTAPEPTAAPSEETAGERGDPGGTEPVASDRPAPTTQVPPLVAPTPSPHVASRPVAASIRVGVQRQGGVYLSRPGRRQPEEALPFRAPAVPALPHALQIARALRPLMRRVPSLTERVLDEEATARRIAEQRIWVPIERPALSRWLELALVVDQSRSMAVWNRTVMEFRRILERLGAFRDVRVWTLHTDTAGGPPRLSASTNSPTSSPRPSSPKELADPNGNRLVLVITDCVAPAWRDNAVDDLLHVWGQTALVAIVQMLPQRLWRQTGLAAEAVSLRSPVAGAPNANLLVRRDSAHWRVEEPVDDGDPDPGDRGGGRRSSAPIPIPVVTLEASWFTPWARLVGGADTGWVPTAVTWVSDSRRAQNRQQPQAEGMPPPRSAEERIERFQATASPTALKLAGYLASVPLSLPVMRLVQQVMLSDSANTHLAEVFLGGLLEQRSPDGATADPETVEYEFVDGVRDALRDMVLRTDSWRVVREVAKYMEERVGQPLDFDALLADPAQQLSLPPEYRPFAEVTAQTLRRMGGRYGEVADRLEQASLISPVKSPMTSIIRARLRGRPFEAGWRPGSKLVHELVDVTEALAPVVGSSGAAARYPLQRNVLDMVRPESVTKILFEEMR